MSTAEQTIIETIRQSYQNDVRPPTHAIGETIETMVAMRDGIRLRTMICRPEGDGPWPVLFVRTPYPMADLFRAHGEAYAQRGFAYVVQFCRGTVGSEGIWKPNVNEPDDGIDSVNWLAGQSWCRSIGMHGVSYMALTGWIIADQLPDKVKTLYLCHYGVDRYRSAYKDGLFRHDILTGWAMGNAGRPVTDDEHFAADYLKACRHRPHITVDENLWGVKLDWYRDWITQTDEDSPYWQMGFWGKLKQIPEKIKVPVCIVAGWFDHHLEGTVLGYEKLNPQTKKMSRLIVGAWDHDFKPAIPGHQNKHAALNINADMFHWFDTILQDDRLPDPEIRTYVIGEDRWQSWDHWPIRRQAEKTLYLTACRHDNPAAYRLSSDKPDQTGAIEYQYDPDNPVYTNGGETIFMSKTIRGSCLQNPPGDREDVISFISDVMTEDTLVTGRINIRLFVSSDCADTCFTAKIMDLMPDGKAYNIRSGLTTLAYRNGSRKRRSYQPGRIEELNITLLPVTWSIRAGSRIRVDIASSNFPEYAIHSNQQGIWSIQETTKIANQSVHIGGPYAAAIQLGLK